MLRLIVWVFLAGFAATTGSAQQILDRELQSDDLSRADKRYLRAILATDGAYKGPIKGRWTDESQVALEQVVSASFGPQPMTWRMLAIMARNFDIGLTSGGWRPFYDEQTNMSYLLPYAFMGRPDIGPGTVWQDTRQSLVIRTYVSNAETTQQQHAWVDENSIDTAPRTRLRFKDRLVSSGLLRDYLHTVYMRSVREGDQFSTAQIQWRPNMQTSARLVIASLTRGQMDPLELPETGPLRRAINALQREENGQTEPDSNGEAPDQSPRQDGLVGTGFYVNNTDLVTASAVLDACDALRLGDGTGLEVISRNRVQGLAIVTSQSRSDSWLAFDPAPQAEPGQMMATRGIAARDGAFQGLARARGRVIGETLVANNGLRLRVSLPRRPGNIGAPVFGQSGQVMGIVAARPDGSDDNAALMTPVRQLAATLIRNRILFQYQDVNALQIGDSQVAKNIRQAIVPLFCQ